MAALSQYSVDQLAARVSRLEDERAILQLLSRYSFALDAAAYEDLGSLFTDDAEYEYPAYGGSFFDDGAASRLQVFRGRSEIVGMMSHAAYREVLGRCQHYASGGPTAIEVTGETARCFTYYFAVCVQDQDALTPHFHKHGFAVWAFRKVGGEWKISQHRRRRVGDPSQGELLNGYPIAAS